MIFCDVHNSGKNSKSHYIIAIDKDDAFKIASTQNGVPNDITILSPEENIQKLMDSGQTGILGKRISGQSFHDVFFNKTPEKIQDPGFFIQSNK